VTAAARQDALLCTFVVGDLLLGMPVDAVSEVVLGGSVTVVPLAPPAVLGLLNLRGRIVPAVDVRTRFGLAPRPADQVPTHVIVQVQDEHVSLVVDRTSDVVAVTEAEREDVPETVGPEIRRLLTSSYQREGALLLVLDPDLVLTDT
jgi:purine-binding chemotaxis protein CheW